MKKLSRFSVAVFGLLALSSCALPPREAWRVIQHDGLFPYFAVEMGRRPVPTYVHLSAVNSPRLVTLTSSAKSPRPVLTSSVYVKRPACCLVGNAYFDSTPRVAAAPAPRPPLAPVPPLVVTHPPSKPQSQPTFTAQPVAKPKPASVEPVHVVAKESSKPKFPPVSPPKPEPRHKSVPSSIADEIASAPKAKAAPEPAAAEAKPKLPPNPTPVPNPNRISEGKPAGTGTVTELPYGTIIPGRPGLVNSPFAGKNQLVDVTGLEPGQEVKCPYSGRLFRVPGVKQAKSDVKTELEPPPAGKKKE